MKNDVNLVFNLRFTQNLQSCAAVRRLECRPAQFGGAQFSFNLHLLLVGSLFIGNSSSVRRSSVGHSSSATLHRGFTSIQFGTELNSPEVYLPDVDYIRLIKIHSEKESKTFQIRPDLFGAWSAVHGIGFEDSRITRFYWERNTGLRLAGKSYERDSKELRKSAKSSSKASNAW